MEGQCSNPKCHNGKVKEDSGQVHTCWECLQAGRLDTHSEKVPDSKIRI